MLPKEPPSSHNSRFDSGIDRINVWVIGNKAPQMEAYKVAKFAGATFGSLELGFSGEESWRLAQRAVEGRDVIPNALEAVELTFGISGVSRATTHQLVRGRVGASYGQQSMRANNMHGFNMRVPDSIDRLAPPGLVKRYRESLSHLRRLYDRLLAEGVPYQDARYVLPMGIETHMVMTINLLALKSFLQRRLCNRMQWEINYVARLMHDATVRQLPWVGRELRSGCEKRGVCQTLDPMFEPSCLSASTIDWCEDRPEMDPQYNWPNSANDAVIHFEAIDRDRLKAEWERPVVASMAEWRAEPLTTREDGIWQM